VSSSQPAKGWVSQWLSVDREDNDFCSALCDLEQLRSMLRRLTRARRLYLGLFALVCLLTILSLFLDADGFLGPWLLVLVLLPYLYTDIKIKVLKALAARSDG
jgi:predicted nucleic acid-binding Zn ribbon protein